MPSDRLRVRGGLRRRRIDHNSGAGEKVDDCRIGRGDQQSATTRSRSSFCFPYHLAQIIADLLARKAKVQSNDAR